MCKTHTAECFVVDAGARYGLHPTWQLAEHVGLFDLYEADPLEAERLIRKYAGRPNVSIHQVALAEGPGELEFELRHHRALSSSFQMAKEAVDGEYKSDQFTAIESITVRADSLDRIYPETDVHFLKLDVVGAELQVFRGATKLLSSSVQGVRAEVCFAPVFDGAPLFGDIDAFLRAQGMILLNLDYDGRGVPRTPFTLNNQYGRLVSSDGVWVIPNEVLAERPGSGATQALRRPSLFLLLNGASDYAVEALLMWAEAGGLSQGDPESPLYQCVKRQIALLFKDLHYAPQMDQQLIHDTWVRIFLEPFPELNMFWETIDQ